MQRLLFGYYDVLLCNNYFQYILTPAEERGPDPFDVVFPKMTKCTLNTYGPSGTVQNHDALCVMTVNVLNEKARERDGLYPLLKSEQG